MIYDIQNYKKIMKIENITYEDLASKALIPLVTIKKIFSGATKNPRMDTMVAIELALTDILHSKNKSLVLDHFDNKALETIFLQIPKTLLFQLEFLAERKNTTIENLVQNYLFEFISTSIHNFLTEEDYANMCKYVEKHLITKNDD